ncbi:MAG: 2-phospho-L-lactate transferase [Dehalococcoidia bacterium]|nr:2-phospho-L-lactate transferase [Dehalococcoidia bacterium]
MAGVLALAGGVGGAKLVWGLAQILTPDNLTVVVNTGDDDEFHGLHVSPDLDTVMYTLAGMANPETGWGLVGETFQALAALQKLGAPTWFNLGDRDLATHIRRTELLRKGSTLSHVTEQLCQHLGVRCRVAPMTDARVRTTVTTDQGVMPFQEYFVKHRCEPQVKDLVFKGADWALPSPGFDKALREADAIVFCPSNPFVSIGPIMALQGVRQRIELFKGPRITISPIIGGEAVKGPAAKMFRELGEEPSSLAVARRMSGLCTHFVLDNVDAALVPQVVKLGMQVEATNTFMTTPEDKIRLAMFVCGLAGVSLK